MLSIQEMVDKTEKQRRELKQALGSGVFHPELCSIFENQKAADYYELKQSLRNIPLREFLAKSGTTGIAGAIYLIPDKIHEDLIFYSKITDIVPVIGRLVTGWNGGDLKVNIVSDESYVPHEFSGGGRIPTSTVESMQATIAPTSFALPIIISEDLVEDAAYDLVEYHVQRAALAMGEKSSELALTVLKTATDGWGTVNGGVSGDADETKWQGASTTDIDDCIAALTDDHWIGNTMVITPEAWEHSVQSTLFEYGTAVGSAADTYWKPQQTSRLHGAAVLGPVAEGFHIRIGSPPLDVLFSTNQALHAAVDTTALTNCVTIVFDRNNALLTGRKRWMQINNYANPVSDLTGAIVSARQDSVTLYDDAIAVITED